MLNFLLLDLQIFSLGLLILLLLKILPVLLQPSFCLPSAIPISLLNPVINNNVLESFDIAHITNVSNVGDALGYKEIPYFLSCFSWEKMDQWYHWHRCENWGSDHLCITQPQSHTCKCGANKVQSSISQASFSPFSFLFGVAIIMKWVLWPHQLGIWLKWCREIEFSCSQTCYQI